MSELVDKISARYAEEIAGLPSIGTLTSFLLVAAAAYRIEHMGLGWPPTISQVFSTEISKFFAAEHGVLTGLSLGWFLISAGVAFLLRSIYGVMMQFMFRKLGNWWVIEKYVRDAHDAAIASGITAFPLHGHCTTLVSLEVAVQRKAFQRIHAVGLVTFTCAALCIPNLTDALSLTVAFCCLNGLIFVEISALKIYLTRLFPALCVAWTSEGKQGKFGET